VRTGAFGHCSRINSSPGADVNWKNEYSAPLHVACANGDSSKVVEALLAAGANVNATLGNGFTPLLALICREPKAPITSTSRLTIARLLLAANCDVNKELEEGRTALVYACCHNRSDDLIRLLCEHGAVLTREALFSCFYYDYPHALIARISCLLEHGMDINVKDSVGRTALHWAATKRNTDVLRLLLDHDADVSIQSPDRRTALMDVSSRVLCDQIFRDDEIPILRMLLERMSKVDKKLIDLQDVEGCTALHLAARYNSWQVIHELLNWGPDILCRADKASDTALHSCVLCHGEESRRLSNLQCLVEHANGYGLDGINIQDQRGRTVLHLALENADSNRSVIEYLSTKADVSIQDMEGKTPLHIAVKSDFSEILVQMLLRSRHATEAANTLDCYGRTALHDAVLLNNFNLVEAISQIADVNIRSHEGKTALHYALTGRAITCVELLLKRNANTSVRDNDGNTPLVLACTLFDHEIQSHLTIIFQLYKRGIAYGDV